MKPTDLLTKLLSTPEDLSVRQVYADQLIEAGDPRGTFIAHQLAQATLDQLDERYPPMIASARRLELAHRAKWLEPVLALLGTRDVRQVRPLFRNGFLHRLALSPEQVEHYPAIAQLEPVAGIELEVHEHLAEEFRHAKAPAAFRVLAVVPSGWFTASSVGNVLAWGMPRLRELDLSGADLGHMGGELLANAPTDLEEFEGYVPPPPFEKGQLTRLVLQGCKLRDAGVRTLLSAAHLTALEELDLSGNDLAQPETLEALKRAPHLSRLRRLGLATNKVPLEALAGWDVLPKLQALLLPQSITAATLTKLFPRPSPHLRELEVRSAKDLMKTPQALLDAAEAVTALHLGTTSLGDEGWAALLKAPSTQRLIHLQANGCSLSDDAVAALCSSTLRRLVTLDLSSNKLTDAALELLAGWEGVGLLTHLRLSNNRKLTARGYDALIQAKAFQPALLDVGKVSDAKARKALQARFGDALLVG